MNDFIKTGGDKALDFINKFFMKAKAGIFVVDEQQDKKRSAKKMDDLINELGKS